jgi:hypothetical protein
VHASQRSVLGLALVLGATAVAYRGVLDLELMGWDSYPTIAASRIASASDLAGTFGEELMDGRYPGGRFYRPLTNLLFALDFALHGLEPLGYQLTNLGLLAAGVVAVHALARRLLGDGPGAFVATAAFALHPLQLEWLPAAARRADMLATLFTVLALLASLPGPRSRPVWSALAVLFAAASKEIGAVALPLCVAAAALLASPREPRLRAGSALAAALRGGALPAAAFAAYLAARLAALGGLGGHPESSLALGALRGLAGLPDYARSLLLPQPLFGAPALDLAAWLALAGGAAAGLALTTRAGGLRAGSAGGLCAGAYPPRRLLALLAGWLGLLLATTGVSGVRAAWYGAPFLPAYAIGLGLLADGALAAARARRRAAALVAGSVAAALLATHLRYSALGHDYPEWRVASEQARSFLARLGAALAEAEPGTTIAVPGLPLGEAKPIGEVGIRSALCLADYSVQAWAELALPGRPVRVVMRAEPPPTPPQPGVITVDVAPLPSPVLLGEAAP